MFKKILFPSDGSELSATASRAVITLAAELSAKLICVTVVEPYSFSSLSEYRPESMEDFDARMQKIADTRLDIMAAAAQKQGVECKRVTARSFAPYEAIIDTATREGCDLICMASHGRRGLTAVLLGSETQKVLTHSTIPVLVYR
jgi:nucleotide-binding universal stress UspA family protein